MALRRKPRVAIIHSSASKKSTTGEDLAVFLGVCLQLGGYSDIRIIGFSRSTATPTATTSTPPQRKLYVVPYGGTKATLPNHCECCRDEWESLKECNMVIMCVDPVDMAACSEALSSVVKKKADVAIISFDLGVRNHAAVEKHLGSHGIFLLAGAVGISVARNPADGSLQCLGPGSLVVERLNKKQSKGGVKFINLLRSGGIPIRHCKNVNCYTHGAILFNTCHAAAALAGLPMRDFLRDRSARLLWAAMIREGAQALSLAAKGGGWKAANPCGSLTLPQLELFLCLPTPLFCFLSRLVLYFPPALAPAMQMDLSLGRETGVAWTLGAVIRIADAQKTRAPACRAVFSATMLAVRVGNGVPCRTPRSLITEAVGSARSASTRALIRKVVAWCSSVCLGALGLGLVGGRLLASAGMLVIVVVAIVKYAVVGDVVP